MKELKKGLGDDQAAKPKASATDKKDDKEV